MSACYDHTHQPVPENPLRLTGPEVGQLCLYRDKYAKQWMVVEVIARSYVWAPEQHHEKGHGFRRYDWSVIQRGPNRYRSVVVNDTDLFPLTLGQGIPFEDLTLPAQAK